MKPKDYLFIFLLLISAVRVFAQDDTILNKITGSIKDYSEKYPVEKVYLQFDKSYYAAGGDIWFKGYVTAGSKHELSGISGVLNVEMINFKGAIEQAIKLPLVSGLTWGDFKLPDTLQEGVYRIRAYTNWMRNAGSDYFFERTISIGNALSLDVPVAKNEKHAEKKNAPAAKPEPLSHKISVQFFPEGGDLVYGIASEVAFKAVGDDGLGKAVKGVVVDDQKQEVAKFSSTHLGMGLFNLNPVAGKTYQAHVTYRDGSESDIKLPIPAATGYVLHINNTDALSLRLRIDASEHLPGGNTGTGIILLAQSDGDVYYIAASKSVGSSFTAIIPKSKFPSGVIQFTLFASDGEPLNERIVFIKNPDTLNLSLSARDKVFAARTRTKIGLAVKDGRNKPALGNFSVAVIDETKVPANEDDESTIFSSLLLASELKGRIEQPGYYFNTANEQANADLDILMLTQGYRRFEWKKILTGNTSPALYRPETSLQISGYIKTLGGKPVANGKVSLLSSSKGFFMLDTVSDDKGYFIFKNLQFKDSTKFVVQSKTAKDKKNVKIELDSTGDARIIPAKFQPAQYWGVKDSSSVYLVRSKQVYDEQVSHQSGNRTRTLKEVIIKAQKALPNSSNLNGPGNADQVVLAKDIRTTCPSIAHCLDGLLVGVFFQYDMYGVGHPCTYEEGHPVSMKIMVDGFIVDAEVLNTLPTETVESVEVLKSGGFTSIYGQDGYTGLILINTKKGNYTTATATNIVTYMPKGYYKAREFYSPKYDDPKTSSTMQDFRSTVYWNPNIVTDKNGKASFEYYNADTKGTYRVVVEGIDDDGKLGRAVYRYKVE